MPPKKKEEKRWPGMKKQPKTGQPKKPKVKYGDFSHLGRIKPGMSEYQKKTMAEFFKVKEGETQEQWKKRTSTRRVVDIDEVNPSNTRHPLIVMKRKRNIAKIKNKNDYIVTQPMIKEFDFMRFYGIVINFYSIKYGIRKEDLEVGFYFFDNIPFTKERFNNALVLMTGCNNNKINRFQKEGLIEEIVKIIKVYKGEDKHERTGLYRLTKIFSNKLTYIYRTLGRMNELRIKQKTLTILPPEIKQLIQEMNEEIIAIQTGDKKQDLIETNK